MNIRRKLAATLAALTLPLAGSCATADRADVAAGAKPPPGAEIAPPGAVPGPALWQLADDDTTIYLFGTVHALPSDVDWYDERIARAFDASGELVTEIDIGATAMSSQGLAAAGKLPEGQNLRDLMTPENREQYEAALVTLGLPMESLDRLEPWFAAMTMSLLPLLRSGFKTDTGVELSLGKQASDKRRGSLESIDDQINLFDGMPLDAQLAFLDKTVEGMPNAGLTLGAMVAEWLDGDADDLAAMINSELDDPVLYARLLTERNANWAEWIGNRMQQPGTVFIAVGAGHLAGPESVQRQLQARGFEVQRIWQ